MLKFVRFRTIIEEIKLCVSCYKMAVLGRTLGSYKLN